MLSTRIRFNSYNYDFIPTKNTKAPVTFNIKALRGQTRGKRRMGNYRLM
jgi:hypothetical protein